LEFVNRKRLCISEIDGSVFAAFASFRQLLHLFKRSTRIQFESHLESAFERINILACSALQSNQSPNQYAKPTLVKIISPSTLLQASIFGITPAARMPGRRRFQHAFAVFTPTGSNPSSCRLNSHNDTASDFSLRISLGYPLFQALQPL
jgi:hypothetical protein